MSGLLTGQIEAGFEEANKRQALAPDVSRWLANPRNEGVADIGGEETVKISGAANDKQVLADIERLIDAGQVRSSWRDGLSPDERQEASKAIGALNVTVFTGRHRPGAAAARRHRSRPASSTSRSRAWTRIRTSRRPRTLARSASCMKRALQFPKLPQR